MDFPVARNLQIDKNFWGEPYDSDQLKTNNWSGGKKKASDLNELAPEPAIRLGSLWCGRSHGRSRDCQNFLDR